MQSAKHRVTHRSDAAEGQGDEAVLLPALAPFNTGSKLTDSPAPSSPQLKAARSANRPKIAACLSLAWAILATIVAAVSISLHVAEPPPWILVALQLTPSDPGSTADVRNCSDWISKPAATVGAEDPWEATKWIPRMSPCPVAGLPIEELDEHLNFRRGYSLGFVDDAEDKTHILPVLRAVLDPAMHARKRRVLIDLGGRFFNSSVTWFLQSYPLDFTEIHAVEVRQGVFQVPAPSHKTIRANMSYRSRLRPLHTGPADFPPWLLARVHSHRFMASAIDNAGKNIVNVTRWLLEELQVTPEDTVVVKMDIEGSEWAIFQGRRSRCVARVRHRAEAHTRGAADARGHGGGGDGYRGVRVGHLPRWEGGASSVGWGEQCGMGRAVWAGASSVGWGEQCGMGRAVWDGASSVGWGEQCGMRRAVWDGASSVGWGEQCGMGRAVWDGASSVGWGSLGGVWDGAAWLECGMGQPGWSVGWGSLAGVWDGAAWVECGVGQPGWSVGWGSLGGVWGGAAWLECGMGQPGWSVGWGSLAGVWDGAAWVECGMGQPGWSVCRAWLESPLMAQVIDELLVEPGLLESPFMPRVIDKLFVKAHGNHPFTANHPLSPSLFLCHPPVSFCYVQRGWIPPSWHARVIDEALMKRVWSPPSWHARVINELFVEVHYNHHPSMPNHPPLPVSPPHPLLYSLLVLRTAWLDSPLMPRVIDELFVEVHYNHPSMHFFSLISLSISLPSPPLSLCVWGAAWLDSPLMPRVIDEIFVEVHYNHPSMHFFTWTPRNFPHSRQQAGQLLNAMRSAGYYVHAWP
ncbi:unnamed protein product [Closterium sp. NIES-64]|nr:unnamed protein product [Closterium sp. NIES-64]CAI5985795.1 unnamed protein product [Closterium sp. NIES-65]